MFDYFIHEADNVLNAQIHENQYKSADLVEVKIPVSLPEIYNWDTFHPVKGQVQLRHHCYNYVKLRITKDTLYLMCLPNYVKNMLVRTKVIYAKEIDDLPVGKKTSDSSVKKLVLDGIYSFPFAVRQFEPVFKSVTNLRWEPLSSDYPYKAIYERPPETNC